MKGYINQTWPRSFDLGDPVFFIRPDLSAIWLWPSFGLYASNSSFSWGLFHTITTLSLLDQIGLLQIALACRKKFCTWMQAQWLWLPCPNCTPGELLFKGSLQTTWLLPFLILTSTVSAWLIFLPRAISSFLLRRRWPISHLLILTYFLSTYYVLDSVWSVRLWAQSFLMQIFLDVNRMGNKILGALGIQRGEVKVEYSISLKNFSCTFISLWRNSWQLRGAIIDIYHCVSWKCTTVLIWYTYILQNNNHLMVS